MSQSPIVYRWTGEGMVPLPYMAKRADQQFVIGETYRMETAEERSARSHSHYFAAVHEAWTNLPEDQAERFPTSEHLRKWALIQCRYCDQRQTVCSTRAEALRIAAFIKPMDDYAVVTAVEYVVTVYTAKSQSRRAMPGKEFQESKIKVLDLLASMLGVEPEKLSARAREAA